MEMNLREDEIEALLKLDGMTLEVHFAKGIYTAIVSGIFPDIQDKRSISVVNEHRIKAVQQVWGKYLEFRSTPSECKSSSEWLLVNATARVDEFYFNPNRR